MNDFKLIPVCLARLLGADRANEAIELFESSAKVTRDFAIRHLNHLYQGNGSFLATIDGGLADKYPELATKHGLENQKPGFARLDDLTPTPSDRPDTIEEQEEAPVADTSEEVAEAEAVEAEVQEPVETAPDEPQEATEAVETEQEAEVAEATEAPVESPVEATEAVEQEGSVNTEIPSGNV